VDQRVVVLSALYFLSENKSPISAESIRHVRVMVSLFNEEVLSEDEYSQIIDTLADKRYIIRKDDEIEISRTGIALVHSLGERELGQTDCDRLFKLIEGYNIEKTSGYMKKIGEKLKSLQDLRRNKVKEINKSSIRAIGVIIKIEHNYPKLFTQEFKLSREVMNDEKVLDREIGYCKNKFLKSNGYPIITHRENDLLWIIGFTKVDSITLFNKEVDFSKREIINREDVPRWNLLLASTIIEKWLRKLGYIRSRRPGRPFIRYQKFERVSTNAGILREYDAINLDFTELKDDCIFVWIETYTSPLKSILDFLNEKIEDNADKQEILNALNGLKLRIVPSGAEIELNDVLLNRDLTKEIIPTTARTFKEYWITEYGIELSQENQPIFVIKGWNGDLHYPAEMVFIDRYSREKHIGKIRGRAPKYEDPKQRVEKVENLLYGFKEINEDYLQQYFEIELQEYCPTIEKLYELGAFKDAIRISPPLLEFYRGSISLDPSDVFNPSYGSACGKKNLLLTHLILPNDITESEMNKFIESLQRMYESYKFGSIKKDEYLKVLQYNVDAGVQEIEDKIRDLDKVESGESIGIAIIPDDSDYYYSLKRLFPTRVGTPLQEIQYSNFKQIVSKRFRGPKILCLKLLIKMLKEGEAIWLLANSAGLSKDETLFIGIGFSRYPRVGKVSKCAAVLHDSHGHRVSWRVFATPQERTITKQWFDTLLLRIRDIVEKENPSKLVFYRTGTMYSIELDAVGTSLKECDWLGSIKPSFISILDGTNRRIYMDNDAYKNVPPGYALIINEKEGILSTSNYDAHDLKQGTVVPIHLKIEVGDENIIDVLKEYHDQTYLNWRAPETTAKHPLVIKIAERFADLSREGVSIESMFYLDL
jgi:hypothetical protein